MPEAMDPQALQRVQVRARRDCVVIPDLEEGVRFFGDDGLGLKLKGKDRMTALFDTGDAMPLALVQETDELEAER